MSIEVLVKVLMDEQSEWAKVRDESTFSRIPAAQPRVATILEADWLALNERRVWTNKTRDSSQFSGLPDSGFYPEISGFFEADGIFLGNFLLAKNLGKNLGNSQEKFT